MKLKLPKIKILHALISLKYLYILMTIVIIGFVGVLGYFLYTNFYQTITQSQEVILLRQEVAPNYIDIEKVERILESLDKKTTTTPAINFQGIKNPFNTSKIVEVEKVKEEVE